MNDPCCWLLLEGFSLAYSSEFMFVIGLTEVSYIVIVSFSSLFDALLLGCALPLLTRF